MTRARFSRHGDALALRVTGHADYAPGHDVVCAAASALVCTLAAALEALGARPAVCLRPGEADVAARPGPGVAEAFFTVRCGLEALAAAYPRNVRVGGRLEQETEPKPPGFGPGMRGRA